MKSEMKKMTEKEFLQNFIAGGFMVAVALAIANTLSAVLGGIIAGLPIRFAITWALAAKRKGPEFGQRMAAGSAFGVVGTVLFSLTLYFSLSFMGFMHAFALAAIICVVSIVIAKSTSRG